MNESLHFRFDDRLRNLRFNVSVVENPDECVGCGLCEESCPVSAIEVTDEGVEVDEIVCVGCSTCVQVCPRDVLRFYEVRFEEGESVLSPVYVPKAELDVRYIGVDIKTCETCDEKPCVEACPSGVMKGIVEERRIRIENCTGCLECLRVCPYGAVDIELEPVGVTRREPPRFREELCVGCDECRRRCPTGAVEGLLRRGEVGTGCLGCYTCVAYCPTEALKRPDVGPQPRETGLVYQIDPDRCIGCRVCAEACPVDAIVIEEISKMPVISPSACVRCGICAEACPVEAIEEVPTEEAEALGRRIEIVDALLGIVWDRAYEAALEVPLTERKVRIRMETMEEALEEALERERIKRLVRVETRDALVELLKEVRKVAEDLVLGRGKDRQSRG